MNETNQCQYVVMFGQMGFRGLEWSTVDQHFDQLSEAETEAQKHAYWQILEIAARVIKSSQDRP